MLAPVRGRGAAPSVARSGAVWVFGGEGLREAFQVGAVGTAGQGEGGGDPGFDVAATPVGPAAGVVAGGFGEVSGVQAELERG